MALPRIGVALRVRFERDRPDDGARLRGSETDRHAALSALLKEARRQITCLGEVPLVATLRTSPCSTSLPVIETVVCDVVPMLCDGKTSDAGANVSSPTALPEIPMTCGLVGSLSVMVTAPG